MMELLAIFLISALIFALMVLSDYLASLITEVEQLFISQLLEWMNRRYWDWKATTGYLLPIPETDDLDLRILLWRGSDWRWFFDPDKSERLTWLKENANGRYAFAPNKNPVLWFSDPLDAVAYKIRWL